MHKCYQSVLPTTNKLLKQRWDQEYYDEHRRKVSAAGAMVDTRPPKTYMHLHFKMKKLQLEEERLATIERDNRILLEKMSFIMRTKGRVDNKNEYDYKSLNREKRMRELLRVTQENQSILKRIMMRQPEYSRVRWEQDWQENQKFMDSIAAYPRDWWVKSGDRKDKSPSRLSRREKTNMSQQSTSRRNSRASQATRASQEKADRQEE